VRSVVDPKDVDEPKPRRMDRRTFLRAAAVLGVGASTLGALEIFVRRPHRPDLGATNPPDIQHAIDGFIAPARTVDGVEVRFGPIYTSFTTIRLHRTATQTDQATLAKALDAVEDAYPFTPSGVFSFVSYGVPYFERLPGGLDGPLVSRHMPRLLGDPGAIPLKEAVPGPTDAGPHAPGIRKKTFDVPVRVEENDVLLTLRSDSAQILADALAWLGGGSTSLDGSEVGPSGLAGLFEVTSTRLMFVQMGLPRSIAERHRRPYAVAINKDSPMWMGFADQQRSGSGPPEITTFLGNTSARFTTATRGSYFDNASIVHLSHVIMDLEQFYGTEEPYTERVQYMFRSNPLPSHGNADQFTNGGGPSFLDNVFKGANDAFLNATGQTEAGERRLGHLACLQRSTRAADGTPIHIRMDGAGLSSLDVPGGSLQPKLEFTAFVPTAEFFRVLRINAASLDYQQAYAVDPDDNGLERFSTATRRQNFLVPPRRHRAFPLLELT
jgi:hypothetical protein